MRKWDILSIKINGYTLDIASTDSQETQYFDSVLYNWLRKTNKRQVSPKGFLIRYELYDTTTDNIDERRRPYMYDIVYALYLVARDRGWEPGPEWGKFIRYSVEE